MSDRSWSVNTSAFSSLTGKVLRWIHTVFQRTLGRLGASCPQEEDIDGQPDFACVRAEPLERWAAFLPHSFTQGGCVSPHLSWPASTSDDADKSQLHTGDDNTLSRLNHESLSFHFRFSQGPCLRDLLTATPPSQDQTHTDSKREGIIFQ